MPLHVRRVSRCWNSVSVTELFIERHTNYGLVGNIYRGHVVKILPGMQAAFVDIGLPKAGFLHASDILVDPQIPPWGHETASLDLGHEP